MRSLLFVPGDNDRMLVKAATRGADALIIDLEDAVALDRKEAAREVTADYLQTAVHGSTQLYVRVNALTTGELLKDLTAVVPMRPTGILLPKCRHRADMVEVCHYLSALEAAHGIDDNDIRLLVLVTEVPEAVLSLGHESYAHPRLAGLVWGGEDLSSELGAFANRRPDGHYDDAFRLARAMTLLAASRAGVVAIDTVFVDIPDQAGLEAECADARRQGFGAKCAIHPGQVAAINAAFTPREEELAWARRVIDALPPGVGAARVDGKMVDIVHLKLARRLLGHTG